MLDPGRRALLRSRCSVVWLEVSAAEAARRVSGGEKRRPLLEGRAPDARLASLLAARAPLYAEVAAIRIPTDGQSPEQVAARVLESLGISQLADRPVTEISAGERQLALVARALAQEPRLLVMDEPTASLDFGNQVRVLERIAALAAGGISILFSTHDPDHAFLAAQRALLLAEGRVLALGAPREVIRADTLQRLYHVAVQVVPLEGGGHTCLPALK